MFDRVSLMGAFDKAVVNVPLVEPGLETMWDHARGLWMAQVTIALDRNSSARIGLELPHPLYIRCWDVNSGYASTQATTNALILLEAIGRMGGITADDEAEEQTK